MKANIINTDSQYVNLRTGGILTSRRDAVKGLGAILATGCAPWVARAGLLGARGAVFGGSKKYTARDYSQAGLTHMWDGIENVGFGAHDYNALIWKDLIGDIDLTNTNPIIGEDNLLIDGNSTSNGGGFLESAYCEVVFDLTKAPSTKLWLCFGTRWNCLKYENGAGGWQCNDGGGYGFASTYTGLRQFQLYFSSSVGSEMIYQNGEPLQNTGKRENWTWSNSIYFGYGKLNSLSGRVFRVSLYSTVPTLEERQKNLAIDKARFNIP